MLVTNATLITLDEENHILTGQAVYVKNGRIAAVGPEPDLVPRYPHADRIDAGGQYVMPGNICAHTHFYGAFARGMAIPGAPPKDFPEILHKLWWPLDQALDQEAVRLSAQVMLIDAIRSGTTTLFDHHASPNALSGSLDGIAEVVGQAGVRAVLCYEVTDRYGPEKTRLAIDENVRFLNAYGAGESSFIKAVFGIHASLTVSEETLEACREAVPEGVGFHLHVAEHESDEYDSLTKSGLRVVDRLHKHGLLGPTSIVVHGVHVDMREAELLAETGTWVTHQPRSNMNNGVGVSPVEDFMRLGIPVCLGTDGFPHAMWEEARFAYMVQKMHHRDPQRMPGDVVFRMATANNAALAKVYFPEAPLGVLAEGAAADLIFVDYHPPTPLTPRNYPWHMVFGFHERMVTTVIVGGRVLMRDRQLLTLDEEAITARAREVAPGVWERYEQFVP